MLVVHGASPVMLEPLMQLPNGGTVGLRTMMSRSPNTAATIDIRGVDGVPDMKIKFNP